MQVLNPTSTRLDTGFSHEDRWNIAYWYALYTRSRHEKLVDEELKKRGIETFLPLRRVTRRWSDRKKVIEEPLFKSYLFVHAPLRQRWDVLNVKGAVRFVGPSAARPLIVPENDLSAIRLFLEEKIQIDPFPYLKVGERVYVRTGSFRGVEGFIVRKDREARLVVSLDMLMQSVSIAIDAACVEKV